MPIHWAVLGGVYVLSTLVNLYMGAVVYRMRSAAPSIALGFLVSAAGGVVWSTSAWCSRIWPTHQGREVGIYLFVTAIPIVVSGYWLSARGLENGAFRPTVRTWAWLVPMPLFAAVCVLAPPLRPAVLGSIEHRDPWLLSWRLGPMFYVFCGYAWLLFAASSLLELRALRQASGTQRQQLWSSLVSATLPLAGATAMLVIIVGADGLMTTAMPDYAAVALLVMALIDLWAIQQNGLLRVLPVARGLVLEELSEAVFIFDASGHLVDRNRAADDLVASCGFRPASMNTDYRIQDVLTRLGSDVRAEPGEYAVRTLPPREIDLRMSRIISDGHDHGTSVVIRDITGLKLSRREADAANESLRAQIATVERLREELQEQANRDSLTGLANRRRFEVVMAETFEDARARATPFSLLVLDLDHFKEVNDTFGHLVGDDVLVAVGERIAGACAGREQAFRYGGEEFVVLLPGVCREGALARGRDFVEACRLDPVPAVPDRRLTTSGGLATYPDDGPDPMAVLQAADGALYRAKAHGRDRVEVAAGSRLRVLPTPGEGERPGA